MLKPIHIKATGVLSKSGFDKFKKKVTNKLKYTMADVFRDVAAETKIKLGTDIKSSLNVKKDYFAKAIRYRVHNKKVGRMPLLEMHNSIWWFSAHEKGKSISVRRKKFMLLPFQNKSGANRVSPKKFYLKIAELEKTGTTFVKKSKSGKFILYVTLTKENRGKVRQFTKLQRETKNLKKVSYGTAVPIGILVRQVKMKKKIDFVGRASHHFMPKMKSEFENRLSFTNIK